MVLDKYRKQLIEKRSALDVNEDQVKTWHNNNVTKSMKIDMVLAYIDSLELQERCCSTTVELISDQIINYGLEGQE